MTTQSELPPPEASNITVGSDGLLVGTDPPRQPVGITTTDANVSLAPVARYSEEDLARVRTQEKSKLYPQIETLQEKLAALEKERDERKAAENAARKEAEEALRKQQEDEMDVRSLLAQKESEWEKRLEAERTEREKAFQMLEHERRYQEVAEYRQQRLHEEQENIMPELLDLISGNSTEEIEASIAGLRDRTTRILDSARQATQATRRDMPGSRITSPPAGPLENHSENRPLTAEQVENLSFSDYVKNRTKLLGTAAASRNAGLFG